MNDLRTIHADFHEEHSRIGRIIAAILVAAGLLALGVYGYQSNIFRPQQPVPYAALPAPGAPVTH